MFVGGITLYTHMIFQGQISQSDIVLVRFSEPDVVEDSRISDI